MAVDRFADAMKAKLAEKRWDGYRGWDAPDDCPPSLLSRLLLEYVEKGDPIDVGNFAMMLQQRGERIAANTGAIVTKVRRRRDLKQQHYHNAMEEVRALRLQLEAADKELGREPAP